MNDRAADFSLVEVLAALWSARRLIVGATAAAVVVTAVVMIFLPRHYTATATLLVLPSPSDDSGGGAPVFDRFGFELIQAQMGSYRSILASRNVSREVVSELDLDQPPLELTALDFLRRKVDVTLLRQGLSIEVEVTLHEPELAARAANRMAEVSLVKYNDVRSRQVAQTRQFLSEQLEFASAQRAAAEQAYLEFRSQTQIELLAARVDSLVDQKTRLLVLNVQIASVRARLASARQELAGHEPIRTLRQTIFGDSLLGEVARATADNSESLLGLSVQSEELNRTYTSLEELIATSSADLAALEGERREILRRSGLDAEGVDLLTDFYRKETELARLRDEFDLAKIIESGLIKRDEEARVDSVALYPQVQLLDPALPPTRPSRPRVVLSLVVVGAFAALLAAAGGTLHGLIVAGPGRRSVERGSSSG